MSSFGCSASGSVATSEHALNALIDGEPVPEEIKLHLESCSECRSLAASLLATNTQFLRVLYRRFCPDSETMSRYSIGLLEQEAYARVEAHVRHCPCCAEEAQVSKQALTANTEKNLGSNHEGSSP